MAQTNYTPISLYYSTTASAVPTAANLVPGELAINTNDGKLYYEDSSGVVRVLATKSTGTIGGSTTQVQYNSSGSLAGSANFIFNGTNVGIGVTPNANEFGNILQINQTILNDDNGGTNHLSKNAYYSSGWKYISTDFASKYTQASGTHQWATAPSGTAGNAVTFSERMRIDSSGNLGLGVTPSAWGTVGYIAMQFPSGGSISGYKPNNAPIINLSSNLYYDDTNDRYVINGAATRYSQNQGVHSWSRAASGTAGNIITFTQAMTLDASGNLFVACTTFPSASVYGLAYITSGGTNGYLYNTVSSTGAASQIVFGNANGTVGSISTNGSLTSYNVTSDYRLKENIVPMTGALAKVAQLNPVTYRWKTDGSDGQGFIAHELQAVVPDCVTGEKDAIDKNGKPVYQGMDTSHLIATLTAAIQEQQALIDSLTTRLTALENK